MNQAPGSFTLLQDMWSLKMSILAIRMGKEEDRVSWW